MSRTPTGAVVEFFPVTIQHHIQSPVKPADGLVGPAEALDCMAVYVAVDDDQHRYWLRACTAGEQPGRLN